MLPIIHAKDLQEFSTLCREFDANRLFLSINHENRTKKFSDRVEMSKWLSLHLTAYVVDKSNKQAILLRFWMVRCVERDGKSEMLEGLVRLLYLQATYAVQEMSGAYSLSRGYVTWLGDPALVPGEIGEYPEDVAAQALQRAEDELGVVRDAPEAGDDEVPESVPDEASQPAQPAQLELVVKDDEKE